MHFFRELVIFRWEIANRKKTPWGATGIARAHDFWTVLVELLVRLLVAFPTAA